MQSGGKGRQAERREVGFQGNSSIPLFDGAKRVFWTNFFALQDVC